MKVLLSTGWVIAVALFTTSPVCGQVSLIGNGAAAGDPMRGSPVREIDDPSTGNRWLLERGVEHPGGPGRLVLAGRNHAAARAGKGQSPAGEAISGMPVIRAGDVVTLVAHTAVMDAALESLALAPAAAGATLRVRLKIGGRVMEAVALGPGKAEWAPNSEETQ